MEGILQLLQNQTAGTLASVYGMTPTSSGSLLGGLGLNLFHSRSVSQLKPQGLPAALQGSGCIKPKMLTPREEGLTTKIRLSWLRHAHSSLQPTAKACTPYGMQRDLYNPTKSSVSSSRKQIPEQASYLKAIRIPWVAPWAPPTTLTSPRALAARLMERGLSLQFQVWGLFRGWSKGPSCSGSGALGKEVSYGVLLFTVLRIATMT